MMMMMLLVMLTMMKHLFRAPTADFDDGCDFDDEAAGYVDHDDDQGPQ